MIGARSSQQTSTPTPTLTAFASTLPTRGRVDGACGARRALHPEPHDLLLLLAKSLDAERDDVAGFEPHRVRLHAERDTRRRAGGDDVARLHHEELRAVPDD